MVPLHDPQLHRGRPSAKGYAAESTAGPPVRARSPPKPENRANLLLTAAAGIAPFRVRFAEAVGLPPECRVKPMIWSTGRPDLTAMDGEKALAVFENENSGENAVQKAAYERHIPARLIWMRGTGTPKDGAVVEERLCEQLLVRSEYVIPVGELAVDPDDTVVGDAVHAGGRERGQDEGNGQKGRERGPAVHRNPEAEAKVVGEPYGQHAKHDVDADNDEALPATREG